MFSGQIEFEPIDKVQADKSQILACQIDQHLALRPFEQQDAEPLFKLVDNNRAYLRQWLPWLDSNQTVNDSLEFIRASHHRAHHDNGFASAICLDHQIIGTIGLNHIDRGNRLSEIGYWLAEPHQGKGIITRTCKTVLDYGFTSLNLNRIEIRCATENIRSQAVAKRLGLIYEGTIRDASWLYDHFIDVQIYSMLQREWQIPITT